jgi:hypothetical protein
MHAAIPLLKLRGTKRYFPGFGFPARFITPLKAFFGLSAQVVALCISKVAGAYKVDRVKK